MTTIATLKQPSVADEVLRPPSPSKFKDFAFLPFLKKEYRFGLDPNREVCQFFRQGHCPLGNDCPDKHQSDKQFNNLVCKHWLRSLCKKGEACEFLHEYNLRRMPECNFFIRNGYCSSGEDCLYLHIDPETKLVPCPHYDRGFCPLGPMCSKKHTRKAICKFYLAGFCPDGRRDCKEGIHPRWMMAADLPVPTVKVEKEVKPWQDFDGEGGYDFRRDGAGGDQRGGFKRNFQQGDRGRGSKRGNWGNRGYQDRETRY